MKRIYFDHNATTPLHPQVAKYMTSLVEEYWGNPSTVYSIGRDARRLMDEARERIARIIGCLKEEVIFTSGGTESNNLAIIGVARANRKKGNHIITTQIEHPSVLKACKALQKEGAHIQAYDPQAMPKCKTILKKIRYTQDPYQAARHADALAVLTEWDEFKELDFKRIKKLMRHPVLFDARNIYDPQEIKKIGFHYYGMGRN